MHLWHPALWDFSPGAIYAEGPFARPGMAQADRHLETLALPRARSTMRHRPGIQRMPLCCDLNARQLQMAKAPGRGKKCF
ncbi:hypothetical protein AV530_016120 [Patagioenas fasciata monilis]|uniref:Uncharacterized protein n=1 Tax=Patagioenas fasciata monilis TaxID=372326 RepID=A0A1V4JSG6_PATFA|nr:hypothetical protein AV530_016120 [Patagioenas fasciata monilis]